MSAIWIAGETTSMYANRPRSWRRNDLYVCESTCMQNDRHPLLLFFELSFFFLLLSPLFHWHGNFGEIYKENENSKLRSRLFCHNWLQARPPQQACWCFPDADMQAGQLEHPSCCSLTKCISFLKTCTKTNIRHFCRTLPQILTLLLVTRSLKRLEMKLFHSKNSPLTTKKLLSLMIWFVKATRTV